MTTAMAQAFREAGFDTGRAELHDICRKVIGGDRQILKRHVDALLAELRAIEGSAPIFALFDDEADLRDRAQQVLRTVVKIIHGADGGGAQISSDSQEPCGPASNGDGKAAAEPSPGAAHIAGERLSRRGRPHPRSRGRVAAASRIASAEAEQVRTLTKLDTARTPDGQLWKVQTPLDLARIQAGGFQAGFLAKLIRSHVANWPPGATVGDVMAVEVFERLLQKSAELADAL